MSAPSWHTWIGCFLRSLFIQAAFNPREMQATGLASALWPALRHIYSNDDELRAAMKRHLQPFNTHPYLAAALLGGTIHHEMEVAAGRESPDRVDRFKEALAAPLAAMGDTFFGGALQPALGAIAALAALFVGWPGLAAVVGLHLLFEVSLRAWLFGRGLREGDGVLSAIQGLGLPGKVAPLRQIATFVATLAAVAWVTTTARGMGYPGPLIPVVAIAGGAATLPASRKGASPYLAILIAGIFGGLLGATIGGASR